MKRMGKMGREKREQTGDLGYENRAGTLHSHSMMTREKMKLTGSLGFQVQGGSLQSHLKVMRRENMEQSRVACELGLVRPVARG